MAASQLTEKTLDVLQMVASAGSMSMPEMQAQSSLPMTTIHRIVQSLTERGFIMRTGKAAYQLGSASIALPGARSLRDLLAPAARPHLLSLSKSVRNHVHLGVWHEGMVNYLVKQRHGRSRLHSAEGTLLEGYCSALGKVLLSALNEPDLDRYIIDGGFVPLTSNTIVDSDRLRSEVAQVRSQGWAHDDEEISLGLRCLAAPIKDHDGQVIAAVSISTVANAGEPVALNGFLPDLLNTTKDISRKLFPQHHASTSITPVAD